MFSGKTFFRSIYTRNRISRSWINPRTSINETVFVKYNNQEISTVCYDNSLGSWELIVFTIKIYSFILTYFSNGIKVTVKTIVDKMLILILAILKVWGIEEEFLSLSSWTSLKYDWWYCRYIVDVLPCVSYVNVYAHVLICFLFIFSPAFEHTCIKKLSPNAFFVQSKVICQW